jgi:hypothetical protein
VLRIGDPDDPKSTSVGLGYSAYVVRGGTLLSLPAWSDTFATEAAFVQFLTKAVARLTAVTG